MLSEGPTPEESKIVDAHFEYLQHLTHTGVVLLARRTLTTDPKSFGIIIFHAADSSSARVVVENDPAVHLGVMRAELYPFRVALLGLHSFSETTGS